MFTVYGQRSHPYEPIVDHKTKEVLADGSPKKVRLGQWGSKEIANGMAENIKNAVPKKSWKIFVEEE